MTEGNPTYHHLEALHFVTEAPYDEALGVRTNKEHILEKHGFSKGLNIAQKKEFRLPEINTNNFNIKDYLWDQINNGKFVSMLFKDGKWESMGGAAVTYIMSKKDILNNLLFEESKLVSATAHNGEQFPIDHEINLQTYSRRRSIFSKLSGFSNYKGIIPVRLGGGFKLQVDDLTTICDRSYINMSGSFSFNDMGSRVLALSCKEDYSVPRYDTSFMIEIKNGHLIFPNTESTNTLVSTIEADKFVNQIISNLFEKDGKAIDSLLSALLSVRPSMKVHQFEGIYSVPSNTEISTEIIDFDGIESFDINNSNLPLSGNERLIRGKLNSIKYLSSISDDLINYIAYKKETNIIVDELYKSPLLSFEIKKKISQHISKNFNIFSEQQTGATKLGKLLEYIAIDWQTTENTNIKIFQNSNNKITHVSINGYSLAFWEKESCLIDCNNIKTKSSEISQLTGKEILPVHLHALQEGD